MSQSLLYHAFGIREGYEYWRTEYADGCIRFFLLVKPELLVCSRCQSRQVSRKGRRFRELQTVPIGLKPVFLVAEVPQCACRNGGWIWIGGHWVIPPRHGAVWVGGGWARQGRRWVWHDGRLCVDR